MVNEDDHSQSLAGLLKLLASLWAREVTSDSVLLTNPDVSREWQQLTGITSDKIVGMTDELAEEFCRLFVGPKDHLVPLQSVWLTGEFQTSIVTDLTEFSKLCGYRSEWPDLLLDHIANELMILATILQKGDLQPEEKDVVCEIVHTFYERHLKWSVPLLERVVSRDQNGFYRCVATLTQSVFTEIESGYTKNKES